MNSSGGEASDVSDEENTKELVCCAQGEVKRGLIDTSRQYYCGLYDDGFRWTNLENEFYFASNEYFINQSFSYGTLIDERDGKKYRTTKIGSQVWMAENLNFVGFSAGKSDPELEGNLKGRTKCPGNEDSYCEAGGRLYSWTAAMNFDKQFKKTNPNESDIWFEHQGVCPEGWHLPTVSEWSALISFITDAEGSRYAMDYLTSSVGWKNGDSDKYGYTMFPVYGSQGLYPKAMFWTADLAEGSSTDARQITFYDGKREYMNLSKDSLFSVRCIQNSTLEPENLKNDATGLFSHSYTKDEIFASKATYGSMTDERDGLTYKTVVIGTQEWMAQNLNYRTLVGSYCYDDNAANCEVYGRLYTSSAMVKKQNSSYHDVCPIGWHVPSSTEWETLVSYVKANTSTPVGTALKSSVGFECHESKCDTPAPDGTNEFGFSAIGSAWRANGSFSSEGVAANYWMSDYYTEQYVGKSYYKLQRFEQFLYRTETLDLYTLTKGLTADVSVRCVKD